MKGFEHKGTFFFVESESKKRTNPKKMMELLKRSKL